jgi:transcriptional regulator with XRE-family HTH domain
MNHRSSLVGDYLRARRDITQPEDVGLIRESNRRVTGLRREEVASLAGISSEYYLRLEQGRDHQPSEQVLNALARALQLDADAIEYLHRLARPRPRRPRPAQQPRLPDAALQRLLDRWSTVPAFIADDNLDVVAGNAAADALGGGSMSRGANRMLHTFTRTARAAYPDWLTRARELVAVFRMRADPDDPRMQDLVGTLSIRDAEFAALWARHDVHVFTSGTTIETVEPFGAVEFEWDEFVIPGYHGLTMTTVFAASGSQAASVLAYVNERVRQGEDAARDAVDE